MGKRTIATGIVATLVLTVGVGFGTTAYGTPDSEIGERFFVVDLEEAPAPEAYSREDFYEANGGVRNDGEPNDRREIEFVENDGEFRLDFGGKIFELYGKLPEENPRNAEEAFELLTKCRDLFEIPNFSEFTLTNVRSSEYDDFVEYEFAETYGSGDSIAEVVGGEFRIGTNDGERWYVRGGYVEVPENFDAEPKIAVEEAFSSLDLTGMNPMQLLSLDPTLTIIFDSDGKPELAWRFDFAKAYERPVEYVSAVDGTPLRQDVKVLF